MERSEETIAFLREAARQLRKLAEGAPEIEEPLHRLARELDEEAGDLSDHGNS